MPRQATYVAAHRLPGRAYASTPRHGYLSPPGRPNYHPWETKYTGGVTQAASRLDFSPLWRLASVRLPMRLPAAVRGACGRPSTQAALSKFVLRAGAKLAVNDGKKFNGAWSLPRI